MAERSATTPTGRMIVSTLHDAMLDLATSRGSETWLHWGDEQVSWAAAYDRACRLAGHLHAEGLGSGDRVAIMLENRPEFLWTYLATNFVGAVAVPVNPRQGALVVSHILDDCEPAAVVFAEPTEALVGELGSRRGIPPGRLLGVDGTGVGTRFDDALRHEPIDVTDVEAPFGQTIMYTSGTTGPPKGVLVRTPVAAARPAVFEHGGITSNDVLYCCLPLFHGNALFVSALGSIAAGAQLALAPRFSASRHWDDCRRYGATQFNAIGAMIPLLLKQPPSPTDRDHDVRVVFSSGCPADQWEPFEQRFNVRLIEWYGIVDYPGNFVNSDGVVGAIGRPSGVEAKVVAESGAEAEPGATGELLLRSPIGDSREYFRNPEATAESRVDGWFQTGDLVRCDTDGNFYFAGRKKDVIRRRGENISPWEPETALLSHPAVKEAAAFAVPSDLGEDELMVAVVLMSDAKATPSELIEHASSSLAAHAVPRYLEIVDEIPKTETSKLQYGLLRDRGVTEHTWDREHQP